MTKTVHGNRKKQEDENIIKSSLYNIDFRRDQKVTLTDYQVLKLRKNIKTDRILKSLKVLITISIVWLQCTIIIRAIFKVLQTKMRLQCSSIVIKHIFIY